MRLHYVSRMGEVQLDLVHDASDEIREFPLQSLASEAVCRSRDSQRTEDATVGSRNRNGHRSEPFGALLAIERDATVPDIRKLVEQSCFVVDGLWCRRWEAITVDDLANPLVGVA
ncbi:hypothetical protein SAMN06264867_105260 [Halorubrum cibi]|uniref:Uncharacterized protein n=1 Tax=Halorubrum cibi TaxID=413815 RepID=A0A521D0E6_9EURY|nr:hypothetical protein SAMN06264867_105260 [Halorubrum cibi]